MADVTVQYYIRTLKRILKTRKNVHKANIKYNKKTTVLAWLHNTEPLKVNFKESKIIYSSGFYFPSIILGIR